MGKYTVAGIRPDMDAVPPDCPPELIAVMQALLRLASPALLRLASPCFVASCVELLSAGMLGAGPL